MFLFMSDYSEIEKILEPIFCDDIIGIIIEYINMKCETCDRFTWNCVECNKLWVESWEEHC